MIKPAKRKPKPYAINSLLPQIVMKREIPNCDVCTTTPSTARRQYLAASKGLMVGGGGNEERKRGGLDDTNKNVH